MPTYHYRCTDCGHEFDQYQRFTDETLTICPSCNGAIRRVIHPVGVVFKGSGWYITDSRKSETATSDKPAAKENGETPAAASGAASEAKTEAKDSASTAKSPEKTSDTKSPASA